MKLQFKILGEPVPWGRVKRSRSGFAYVPKKTREAKESAAAQIAHQLQEQAPEFKLLTAPLCLDIVVYRSKPKSAKKGDKYPSKRPDLDNFIKLVLDAMNSIVFVDDAQVVELHAEKQYDERPRVEIIVAEL